MSDSLWPHGLQHARPPCPSPTPRVHSDSRPSSQWCHPDISSSVIPFSSCPNPSQHQSFPMSQLCMTWPKYWNFTITVSPSSEYSGLIPLGVIDLISLQSKGLSRVLSSPSLQKRPFFGAQPAFMVQLSYPYMTTGKAITLTIWTCQQSDVSAFNKLSKFVIDFLPRSSVQSLSHVRLCDSMYCSVPALPVYHQLPKFTQTHVHWVSDAIQPSHLLPSSLPALNLF